MVHKPTELNRECLKRFKGKVMIKIFSQIIFQHLDYPFVISFPLLQQMLEVNQLFKRKGLFS
jgi:hypothetical protein